MSWTWLLRAGEVARRSGASGGGDAGPAALVVRPRSELAARWSLPLPHLRARALRRHQERRQLGGGGNPPPQALTVRDALRGLTVGLFRRGAADSGAQASIVSKSILAADATDAGGGDAAPAGRPAADHFFNVEQRIDSVFGTVPFYAPRTPGNVLFRLYFDDEPQVTLATGACVRVVPAEGGVDAVLRFVLSNFKSKKTNGISSMNALGAVLELYQPRRPPPRKGDGKNGKDGKGDDAAAVDFARHSDGAGRVAWGCVCEARKAVDQAGRTYLKKKEDLGEKLREGEEAERVRAELPDLTTLSVGEGLSAAVEEGAHEEKSKPGVEWKAKLTAEAKNNERKWREIQIVYASVLKVRTATKHAGGMLFASHKHVLIVS